MPAKEAGLEVRRVWSLLEISSSGETAKRDWKGERKNEIEINNNSCLIFKFFLCDEKFKNSELVKILLIEFFKIFIKDFSLLVFII